MPRDTDYIDDYIDRMAIQEQHRIELLKGIKTEFETAVGNLYKSTKLLDRFRPADGQNEWLDALIDRELYKAFDHLQNVKAQLARRIEGVA